MSEKEEKVRRPEPNARFYWLLFKSTFVVSAFTIGGGYVIIPLLKAKYVDEYHWVTDEETMDVAEMVLGKIGKRLVTMVESLGVLFELL